MKNVTFSDVMLKKLLVMAKNHEITNDDFVSFFIKVYNCKFCANDSNTYNEKVNLLWSIFKDDLINQEVDKDTFVEYSKQIRETLKERELIDNIKANIYDKNEIYGMFSHIPTNVIDNVLVWIRDKYDPKHYL